PERRTNLFFFFFVGVAAVAVFLFLVRDGRLVVAPQRVRRSGRGSEPERAGQCHGDDEERFHFLSDLMCLMRPSTSVGSSLVLNGFIFGLSFDPSRIIFLIFSSV